MGSSCSCGAIGIVVALVGMLALRPLGSMSYLKKAFAKGIPDGC
jgi:hypothetical protein